MKLKPSQHDLTLKSSVRKKIRFSFLLLMSGGLAILCWIAYLIRNVHDKTELPEINPQPVEEAWKKLDARLARITKQHFGGSLPDSIITTVTKNVRGHYSVYLEDLQTGTWWGINEKDSYDPGNLFKVPILVALLKKVEKEELSLDKKIILTPEGKLRDAPPTQNNPGAESLVSIKELAERMIIYSDEAAAKSVGNLISYSNLQEGLYATKLPPLLPTTQLPLISPKQYVNLLRSLFLSNYLNKNSCDLILSLLSNTAYTHRLRAGVPEKIMVAHAVNSISGIGDSHDCGIIFLQKRPYILCIMSTNTTQEESDRVISTVSHQIYKFMNRGMLLSFNF